MSANKEYSKKILIHYFKLLSEKEYVNFDNECESEIKEVAV